MNTPSNVYKFSDYRGFLKDRYAQLKETDPAFSFRNFSKQAGFGSPNYLKLVMDGKRNLSEEAIGKFAKGLRLDSHETEYFRYLVQGNQCDDIQRKRVFEAKLEYLKELFKVKDLVPELYDYYHDWYHSAIREVIKNGAVKNDPKAIGQSLVPAIDEEKVQKSISLLLNLGFIQDNNGRLEHVEGSASTKKTALAEKIHHEQMAELAAQSIYMQGPETQGFESVTVSLPSEKVQELKTRIAAIVNELAQENTSNANAAVYQLNIQLFALTRSPADANKQEECSAEESAA